MLKAGENTIDAMEDLYPGIREQVAAFEAADIPCCPECGSADTAVMRSGITGRAIHIAAATTKYRPAAMDGASMYRCNACSHRFD